jgi:hypothetical protein
MKRLIKREAKRETVGGEWDEGGEEKKANTQQLHPWLSGRSSVEINIAPRNKNRWESERVGINTVVIRVKWTWKLFGGGRRGMNAREFGGSIDGSSDEVNSSKSGGFSRRFRPSYPLLSGVHLVPVWYSDYTPSLDL